MNKLDILKKVWALIEKVLDALKAKLEEIAAGE